MSATPPAASDVRRIVVTRLRFLGDVVLSTPLLSALRAVAPTARIDYITDARFAPVLEHHPDVDVVHPMDPRAGIVSTWRLAQRVRRADWWFDLFGNPRSAMLTAMARPRYSVGPARGLRSRVFHERRARPEGDRSAILHHLDKLRPVLGPRYSTLDLADISLVVTPDERARVLAQVLGDEVPGVLLHPGSKWPDKAWPAARWVELAASLREAGVGPMWLVTPPGEEAMADSVARQAGAGLRRLPLLPLRDLMAVVALSRAYVGNDGGILHCAVALRTPSVGLFGPTDPDIWFPYEKTGPFRVIHNDVAFDDPRRSRLVELPVNVVVAALHEVLSLAPPGTSHAAS